MLRRIFVPRRDEVTGEWRRLHNEELNDLYCSPNIVWVIKWRRMRWAGHVARMGEERGCIGSWWGNRREGDHWGEPFIYYLCIDTSFRRLGIYQRTIQSAHLSFHYKSVFTVFYMFQPKRSLSSVNYTLYKRS